MEVTGVMKEDVMTDKDRNVPFQRDMDVESAIREDVMTGKHLNGDQPIG